MSWQQLDSVDHLVKIWMRKWSSYCLLFLTTANSILLPSATTVVNYQMIESVQDSTLV